MSTATAGAPVLIMAGGTGGHIFPGIAVGRELLARGVAVAWLGTNAGMEARLAPAAGFSVETLAFSGIRRKGPGTLLLSPLRLLRAVIAARGVLRRLAPRSVLSLGGYAAAPGGIAAWLARIPLVVHEQNRSPGFTNRLLAKFARRVLSGFADAFRHGEWVGNPVRAEIIALPAPRERYAGRSGPLHLLVLGGSQGAQALNAAVPQALAQASAELRGEVRHQCGTRHVESARAAYAAAGVAAQIDAFIEDMAGAYAWADLVICRAGALTVAELAAAGVPAILIPYPAAVDDHQTRNAETLVAAGAALLLPESEASASAIAASLDRLGNRAQLLAMAEAARAQARPDAAARIADACLEVAA
ncbi:MAG TPA: undecaprenyldiphospho-muramoylpentapeptide beta-N-acetylglucosaminyltransferase [Rhodanobacteraceae bacterium]|nr:undecaprenyldiphospho-muramoylpentapeptide beta-N-acetylglucosaminyltransferase [Rhodanobacteraceae bacterium]